jgi:hypothetical protein
MAAVATGLIAIAAAPLVAHAQVADKAADWSARSTASGVLSSNTFNYTTFEELKAASNGTISSNPPNNEIGLEPTINLTGRNSLKITTYSSASANGGTWQEWLDGTTGNRFDKFYIQFAIYFPRDTLAYRWSGGDGQLKVLNIERYGGGQVTVTNPKFLGFPGMMLNGSSGMSKAYTNTPVSNVGTEYVYQSAIDTGTPANPATSCEFWSRYGAARGITVNENYGYDASKPYLDQRGLPGGFPNRCAVNAGVPYAMNDWTVIEVFVDTSNPDTSVNTVRTWVAKYGNAPRLTTNEIGTAQINRNSDYYRRFELMNYDTPRLAEPGRPTLYTYFDEVIVSTAPIKFPGGYSLPDSNGPRPNPPTSVRAE